MKDRVEQVQAEQWQPQEVLSWAAVTFGEDVEMASGFGVEGMVLIDIASKMDLGIKVFTLDTEFLFPETYELIARVEERYDIRVERVRPAITAAEQERSLGAALWSSNPDQCCNIRKVEPLRKKLSGLRAWITAIRRDQTSYRANARKVEWDAKFQLAKINPIVDWTKEEVWSYVRKHDVPYNPLHDQNYPSIGCTHCTRAVLSGEDPRAGRWAGRQKTECGLHLTVAQPEQFQR